MLLLLNAGCRGDAFRIAFAEIGTLRSLLPKEVHILALTASAMKDTFDCVVERLSMQNPHVIGLPPSRDNIKYVVKPAIKTVEFVQCLCDELNATRTAMPKTVLFCATVQQVADIYSLIRRCLGSNITETPGALNVLWFRLVDMFTAGSTPIMRERVLEEFCKNKTKLCLIIATSAFGMGVDCPDITRIISWGPPPTLEDLLQQTGRAGRDGSQSEAILYFRKPVKISSSMQEYGNNQSICRRRLLYNIFFLVHTPTTLYLVSVVIYVLSYVFAINDCNVELHCRYLVMLLYTDELLRYVCNVDVL